MRRGLVPDLLGVGSGLPLWPMLAFAVLGTPAAILLRRRWLAGRARYAAAVLGYAEMGGGE